MVEEQENFVRMAHAKIQCNIIIAQAKKTYCTEVCKNAVSEAKDMHKVWNEVKEMKNGHKLQTYPIKLDFFSQTD